MIPILTWENGVGSITIQAHRESMERLLDTAASFNEAVLLLAKAIEGVARKDRTP